MPSGAVAGKFKVKACGNAHAWCQVCRPDMAEKLRKPKRPRKPTDRPCRNCGRCDVCLGLVASEGQKICRRCGETKSFAAFPRRADTGGVRNHCKACIGKGKKRSIKCSECLAWFSGTTTQDRTLCPKCRPPLTKPCARCGKPFVGSMDQRRYCSTECRQATSVEQRATAHRRLRDDALAAYSTTADPSCSCCGETIAIFLALDHINGGGHKQRQETGGGGFWVWLKKNGYPPGFRVLCHNCNIGRQINGGTCPHEETP